MVDVNRVARPAGALFLSPHLDDAVFGCGELIASSPQPVVATVFAGRPPPGSPHTDWDAECGFRPGEDVVGARREEDRRALDVLCALPTWLDFCDDQYRCSYAMDELVEALDTLLQRHLPPIAFFPLGLFHADHRRASDATTVLVKRFGAIRWHVYEDAIYRRIPGLVQQRMASLEQRGFALDRHSFAIDASAHARKDEAVACYRSQLGGLRNRPAHRDVLAPETYWQLTPRGGPP